MPSKVPPGPRSLPRALVTTIKFQRDNAAVLDEGRRRYGDVWTLRLAAGPTMVICSDPELFKELLTGDPQCLHTNSDLVAKPLVGEHSVLVLNEDAHRAARKLLEPSFSEERMQRYSGLIAQVCEGELAALPLRQQIQLLALFERITLRSIMAVIFGVTESEHRQDLVSRLKDLLAWSYSAVNVARLQAAAIHGWDMPRSFLKVRKPVDTLILKEVQKTREDSRLDERDDVLAVLVKARHDDGSPLTDQEIRDHVMTLLMQGHTSTASAIAWTFERLLRHPDSLERLRAEAQTDGREYMDAVMKEALRLRPPIAFLMRRIDGRPYMLGEYELQPGEIVAGSIYLLHRREDLYPDPDRFRPERFLEDSAPMPQSFGGGYRGCLGMGFAVNEIRVVVRTVLQQARFELVDERSEKIGRRAVQFVPAKGAQAVLVERTTPVREVGSAV
jgi:cytochrome P450